jgi:hypothetical protein
MSRGLGGVQRRVLAAVAAHGVDPLTDFDERPVVAWERYPSWLAVVELAPRVGLEGAGRAGVESVRRAVLGLERAGLVDTRYVLRRQGFSEPREMLAARLVPRGECRFSFLVADSALSTCGVAEFSRRWRTRFSHFRGGSENGNR